MDSVLAMVRHGQTDWNLAGRLQGQTDIPLNQTGFDQALAVAEPLRGQGWDLVLASPLGRAQQTAQVIAENLRIPVGPPISALVERGFGPLEGEIRARLDEELVQQMLQQAEPAQEVLHRAVLGLHQLTEQYSGQQILCVSHGALMRIVRDALAGKKLARGVENGEVISIDLSQLRTLHEQLLRGEFAMR